MIDFHTHILPHMDDGSSDVGESIQLMKMLKDQGVGTVVATSHYYHTKESISEFLTRRQRAYDLLREAVEGMDVPDIRLGAEVSFFSGMSRLSDFDRLKIQGTEAILIEMPFSIWTAGIISEVYSIINNHGLTPILAHVERYPDFPVAIDKLNDLIDMGALFQINGEYILSGKSRRQALDQLKRGDHFLLGSDSHNLRTRVPNLGEAASVIRKKLGSDRFLTVDRLGREIMNGSDQ